MPRQGHSHVVYAKSPGGVVATARRVEAFRDDIERAADEAGVDPDMIEGMVLLESAGRPDARASDDLEGAVGLTQILAETGANLLDMQVDVRASERLTRRLANARGPREADRIRARRRQVDERFDPQKSLAATGRYLKLAKDEFGREDLAVVSYHMGIGNLQRCSVPTGTTTRATRSSSSTPPRTSTRAPTGCSPGWGTTRRPTSGGCSLRTR